MWHDDLSWSTENFKTLIWPELNKVLQGKLDSIEGSERDQDLDIDRQSGVDYWWVEKDAGRTPISSRVQVDDGRKGFPYNTFTVRRSRVTGTRTEYQKLIEARENRRLYPSIAIQGYITQKQEGELVSFGVAYTDKILDYIAGNPTSINKTSNADFYVIPFNAVAHYRWPQHPLHSLLTPEQQAYHERNAILNRIGQAHLNPDMNLHKVNLILAEYGFRFGQSSPNKVTDWDRFTLEQLKEIEGKLS